MRKKYTFKTQQNLSYLKKRKNFLKKNFTKNPDYLVDGFPKYVRREEMTRLLARIELFKKIINVQGSIIECGVYSEMVCFRLYYQVFTSPLEES